MHTMLISLALAALLCNPALALFPGWFSNNLIPRDAANDTVAECSREKACAFNICCGKSGKCGTTTEFCGLQEGCLRDCDQPHDPHCEATNRADGRTIGYYESWARYRTCQSVTLETLNVTGYTHINYGFVYFDPKTFAIAPTDDGEPPMYANFTNLKVDHPGLQTWVAIGGWSFNDPGPTANAFSDMVATKESRGTFITAITGFMHTYAFDGVDIDWEYPVDADRGGKPEDKENFVAFAKEVHDALQTAGYGFSITLPASYKHLKNIDVTGMNDHVDFFNIMAYDMHGVYDDAPGGVGPYVLPHTNLTEIEAFLDILLKAKVDSGKVNLGLAFYGHTFTLKDPKCDKPDGVCQFDGDGKGAGKGAGKKGNCTATEGMLNLEEILDIVAKEKCSPVIDDKAAIKYVTYDDNQWIGYDDEETLGIKRAAANRRCLGGTMVWAMDTIDQKSPSMLPPAALDQTRRLPSAANGTAVSDCDLFKVPDKGTCKTIATPEKNFTCSQLMAWNPQISLQDWNNLKADSSICTSPPGGWYVLAPPPPKASADGGAASSTAAASGTAPAGPVQCTTSAAVASGDGCDKFASSYGIVASQLYAWNPSLDTSCKNLEAGKSYCVGAGSGGGAPTGAAGSGYNASSPSSTAAVNGSAVASASDTMITSPSESAVGSDSGSVTATATATATATGDASGAVQCTSSAAVAKGDGCDKFASANGIAPSQLYAWNPSLDASCKNLEAGKSYCVGAGSGGGVSPTAPSNASSSAAVQSSSVSTASGSTITSWTGYDIGPIRGGGASSTESTYAPHCNSFAAPGPTDNCEVFASAQHIELKQLFDYNADLDAACKNLVAGVDYCVGTATVGLLSTPSPDATATAVASGSVTDNSASASVGISSRAIATASYAPLSNAPVASTGFPDDAPSGNASPIGAPPIYANSSATSTVAAPSSYAASSTTDVPSSDAPPSAAPTSAPSDTAAPPAADGAKPTAVQAGIDPSCTKFIEVSKGDTCLEFAARNGIEPEQLYAMNPVLGANGENCPQKFWAETSYCVAA